MNNIADIKRRIASVRQTRQITGAMETISVSKMRKSAEACEKSRAYIDGLSSVLDSILESPDDALAEFIAPPVHGTDAVIVISSEKGLCGAFNHDLIKAADNSVGENSLVIPIGQTAESHFSERENVDRSFVSLLSSRGMAKVGALTDKLLELYGNEIKSVILVYSRLVNKAMSTVVTKRLLPLEKSEKEKDGNQKLEFDPSPNAVLEGLLPLYISATIYGAIQDSAAAEHSARRAAMSSSTKNADAMIDVLTLEYSRARQTAVTAQITEIIGSRQAQGAKGDRR